MTIDTNNRPKFITVHAKIARGAFANWMIRERISDYGDLKRFKNLGYEYSDKLSTINEPVYVCNKLKGFGLSVRNK